MENAVSKFLEQDFECTICLELSISPIHSCSNGHIVCGLCSDQVKKCGICREDGLRPNGVAERLAHKYFIEAACRNFESGCKTPIKSTKLKDHLSLCEYRPIRCAEKTMNDDCQAPTFEMREFVDHLKVHHETHKLKAGIDGEYNFSIWCECLKNRREFYRLREFTCEINGQHFLVHLVLYRTAFCWWITVIGGQTEADNYYYTTQLTCPSKNIELTWKFPVLPFHKFNTFEKVFKLGQCVRMDYEVLTAVQKNILAPNNIRKVQFGFKIQTLIRISPWLIKIFKKQCVPPSLN